MSVEYNYSRGHLNAVERELRQAVGQYGRRNAYYKIGITGNPEERWRGHQRERAQENDTWDKMVVIYQTSSWEHACECERRLIEYCDAKQHVHRAETFSERHGGGGRPPTTHEGPFYVYILLAG
jgi:predicted GIY-YIG superfamily endonuclease